MTVRAQAYVRKNRLVVLGVADLEDGPVPFTYSSGLEEAVDDGPIDFGVDLHPAVQKAIDGSEQPVQDMIERGQMAMVAESLVLRSRVGDQNAMAMIGAIRNSAKSGSERAKVGYRMICDFNRKNPMGKANAAFAGDNEQIVALAKNHLHSSNDMQRAASILVYVPSIHIDRAVVLVANGADLTDGQLVKMAARTLPSGSRAAFRAGVAKCLRPPSRDAETRAGQIVGRAMRIQEVRQPGGKVARLSPRAAWELGE